MRTALVSSLALWAGCTSGAADPVAPSAGCTSDSACKGDRICEAGVCVDPDSAFDPSEGSTSSTPEVVVTGGKVHPCGAPPDAPPPDPVAGPDTAEPVVRCVGFDQVAYAAGESGFVEFLADDDRSGITDFQGSCGSFVSRTGASDVFVCGEVEALGGDLYRIGFDVGEFVEEGAFVLDSFAISDLAGNALWLSATFGDDTYERTDVPVAYTSVASSDVDVTAPTVTAIGFDRASYRAGDDTAYVVYEATDGGSGIATFESGCWSIVSRSGETTLYACGTVDRAGGAYRLLFDVSPSAELGEYALVYAAVHDEAGNSVTLSADPGDAVYEGTSIPVATMTVL